jgi:hypothetical protein
VLALADYDSMKCVAHATVLERRRAMLLPYLRGLIEIDANENVQITSLVYRNEHID